MFPAFLGGRVLLTKQVAGYNEALPRCKQYVETTEQFLLVLKSPASLQWRERTTP